MFNRIKSFFKSDPIHIPPKIVKVRVSVHYKRNEKYDFNPRWDGEIWWDNGDYEYHNGGYSTTKRQVQFRNHVCDKTITIIYQFLNSRCSSIWDHVKNDLHSNDRPYGIQPYGAFILCNVMYLYKCMEYCGFEMIEISKTEKLHSYEFRF